jgi:hypothetical protein
MEHMQVVNGKGDASIPADDDSEDESREKTNDDSHMERKRMFQHAQISARPSIFELKS